MFNSVSCLVHLQIVIVSEQFLVSLLSLVSFGRFDTCTFLIQVSALSPSLWDVLRPPLPQITQSNTFQNTFHPCVLVVVMMVVVVLYIYQYMVTSSECNSKYVYRELQNKM